MFEWIEDAGEEDGPARWGLGGDGRRGRPTQPAGASTADGFWRLLNQPAVIALLRQLDLATTARSDSFAGPSSSATAGRATCGRCWNEQWHILRDQESWSEDVGADENAARCARKLVQCYPGRVPVSTPVLRAPRGESGRTVEREGLRTVFAQRFAYICTDDPEHFSQKHVVVAAAAVLLCRWNSSPLR